MQLYVSGVQKFRPAMTFRKTGTPEKIKCVNVCYLRDCINSKKLLIFCLRSGLLKYKSARLTPIPDFDQHLKTLILYFIVKLLKIKNRNSAWFAEKKTAP